MRVPEIDAVLFSAMLFLLLLSTKPSWFCSGTKIVSEFESAKLLLQSQTINSELTFVHSSPSKVRHRRSNMTGEDSTKMKMRALQFLEQVQQQMEKDTGCEKNQSVVLDLLLDNSRWKKEALLAVEVANLLTSLWRIKVANGLSFVENDQFLYKLVRSNVLYSPSVFGSVVCFERDLYKNYTRFCPYAFRDKKLGGKVHAIDISVGHDYLTDRRTIWWREPREQALKRHPKEIEEFYSTRLNDSVAADLINISTPVVNYKGSGFWTRPYYDCFGGKIWMITFLAPFFNESNNFLGVVSIDIELSDIDINQCDKTSGAPLREGDQTNTEDEDVKLLEFMGTHRCKKSTECKPIHGQGFKRGSYLCKCKSGYYFPNPSSSDKVFNGSLIEAAYDLMLKNNSSTYNDGFECLKCSEGCVTCEDSKPCIYQRRLVVRLTLLALDALAIVIVLLLAIFVFVKRQSKVFQASSVLFLELIMLGALLMYLVPVVSFFQLSRILCTMKPWFHHLGFAMAYGSLTLKTWRIKLMFRVRSAKRLDLTDRLLLSRFAVILIVYVIYLLVWSLAAPTDTKRQTTSADLKYWKCGGSGWYYGVLFGDLILLAWGMWLCCRTRNAPSAYYESRYISWAIYNSMFVTCFMALLLLMIQKNTNPDMIYVIEFVQIHVTATTMLLLLFIPKCLLIRRMQQRGLNNEIGNSSITNGGYVRDSTIMERENAELKEEIRRLANKVASLQSRLMKDGNQHLAQTKENKRALCSPCESQDTAELKSLSNSPSTKFVSSRV